MSETPETHLSKCRLCGQEFKSVAQGIPIIGEAPDKRMVKFLGGIFQHLASKHMAHPQLQALIGFAILACIESPDPAIQQAQAEARHNMHRSTIDPKWGPEPFPDAVLRPATEAITTRYYGIDPDRNDFSEELTVDIMKLVTEVRDALLEQGPFAPQAAQSTPEPSGVPT
jgi:hypothetical protein